MGSGIDWSMYASLGTESGSGDGRAIDAARNFVGIGTYFLERA
jgi:hypothetical protein